MEVRSHVGVNTASLSIEQEEAFQNSRLPIYSAGNCSLNWNTILSRHAAYLTDGYEMIAKIMVHQLWVLKASLLFI